MKIFLTIFLSFLFSLSTGCGSSAHVSDLLLERYIQKSDSLQIRTDELLIKIDSLSKSYQTKIFLLILSNQVLLDSINILKTFPGNFDTLQVIQNFWNYSLWPYLFLPLNQRLDFIIDSLNNN